MTNTPFPSLNLNFVVTSQWWAASFERENGESRETQTLGLSLQPESDQMIELENGDLLDWHKVEMSTQTSWANPQQIFGELENSDIGYLNYSRDTGRSVYLQAYVIWNPVLTQFASPQMGRVRVTFRASTIRSTAHQQDRFKWKPGPEHVIHICGMTISRDFSAIQ